MKKIICRLSVLLLFAITLYANSWKNALNEDCDYLSKVISEGWVCYDEAVENGFDLDKSIKNIKQGEINGSKGGAPPGNQNAKKKTTQGLNENKTDKDREKDKDMENEQDKGNGERGNTISDGREEPPTGGNINFEKILAHG